MTKTTMPQLHVGRGVQYGPDGVVTVFPIWSSETGSWSWMKCSSATNLGAAPVA